MNSAIIIPALNPDPALLNYIQELVSRGAGKIIVVDDGSDPAHKKVFDDAGKIPECDVLVHEINRGKGRALKDAFLYYMNAGYDHVYNGVITADADGQHSADDVVRISHVIDASAGKNSRILVLGEREFGKDVPFRSKFGNTLTAFLFRVLYHIRLRDTQTGLRGFPNDVISEFTKLEGDRYEYETNMLMHCSEKKIPIESVTIETIYIDGNQSSHFNPLVDSFRIYRLLLGTFIKFALSSLSSCILDLSVFQILVLLLKPRLPGYIFASTAGARIISAVYNYTVNHRLVFKSSSRHVTSGIKYIVLCVAQMLLSAIFVNLFYGILRIPELAVKAVVDTILFLISFQIQKRFIF